MRRITFGCANSLDNYLARPDHAVDWLRWTSEVAAVMAEYWKTIDTILWGRKTYEVALRQNKDSVAYPGMQSYVFSRTLKETAEGDVIITSSDVATFVRELKGRGGKDICLMGGGELAKSLLEAGLVDEIRLNIHPLLLSSGIPLFHSMSRQIDLELLGCKTFKNGCVLVRYGVRR